MPDSPRRYAEVIAKSGLSIYDPVALDSELWMPNLVLEQLLNEGLQGNSLAGLPLRTRSKVIKEMVCRVLGYPVPTVFNKTQPRFPGQNFDTYIQKSNNLQIWNEEVALTRRYVLIIVSANDLIQRVIVLDGNALAEMDTTGTLTQKYQARIMVGSKTRELVSETDTENLQVILASKPYPVTVNRSPIENPSQETLLPIQEVFRRLSVLIGKTFENAGHDQERNRGSALHRLACQALGYKDYRDDGSFPDIRHQLTEIKLQTSPTIDLGLVRPDSQALLAVPQIQGRSIRHCDVRYAIFYGNIETDGIRITHAVLTTGEMFFGRFAQFQGKVLNKKLQLHLPRSFFA